MYGDFAMTTKYGPPPAEKYGPPGNSKKRKRNVPNEETDEQQFNIFDADEDGNYLPGVPDYISPPPGLELDPVPLTTAKGESYFDKYRNKRQTNSQNFGRTQSQQRTSAGGTASKQSNGPSPANEPRTGRFVPFNVKL